jgi:HAD superfamily hydrolase (TIGR01662 family)
VGETMMKQRVSVVVTDLDNTLFDWVSFWYRSFQPFYDFLIAESGLPEPLLERDIRGLFQQYHTSEHLPAFNEIPAFQTAGLEGSFAVAFERALTRYRQQRRTVILYPGVKESLAAIKSTGSRVVIFTESQKRYTCMRLERLGIRHLVDAVFSPEDISAGLPGEHCAPASAHAGFKYHSLRSGQVKPDPQALLEILQTMHAPAQECIYIGDHLLKDIRMAQDAGITDVHARYGQAQFSEAYQLLRKVSFWTDEEIAREQAFLSHAHLVTPTYTLHTTFREVLDLFEFTGA